MILLVDLPDGRVIQPIRSKVIASAEERAPPRMAVVLLVRTTTRRVSRSLTCLSSARQRACVSAPYRLGYAGPRIAETLDILERDVRLHDPNGPRLWISDSKTPTGVRHVEITPSSRDELLAYRADKVRHGYRIGPDAPFFCTRRGKRWEAGNVRERILEPAVKLANERLNERGLPPLPHVTPHTLRRTYVSIMLLATDFDVTYVQHQVGHAESRMTLDAYSQLLDRRKRDHGVAFDALLADARCTLTGHKASGLGHRLGH
jgi:integrase